MFNLGLCSSILLYIYDVPFFKVTIIWTDKATALLPCTVTGKGLSRTPVTPHPYIK